MERFSDKVSGEERILERNSEISRRLCLNGRKNTPNVQRTGKGPSFQCTNENNKEDLCAARDSGTHL